MKQTLADIRGQALPYVMMMLVAIALCWGMMLNIARLLQQRMIAQNAADNTALSLAVHEARLMNMLQQINKAMADMLFSETVYTKDGLPCGAGVGPPCVVAPVIPQKIPLTDDPLENDVSNIAAILDVYPGISMIGPSVCNFGGTPFGMGVERRFNIDLIIDRLKTMSETAQTIASIGPAWYATSLAQNVSREQELDAHGNAVGPELVAKSSVAGNVAGNTQEIHYYAASHTWFLIPIAGTHVHTVFAKKIGTVLNSWYYGKSDSFQHKRNLVLVEKKRGDPSNAGYPLFGKWFGVAWPDIRAVAAATCYNTKGSSLVLKEGTKPRGTDIHEVLEEAKKGSWLAQLVPFDLFPVLH